MDGVKIFENLKIVRQKNPLIHNITNYVVMNSTANALLALGASPIMAHAKEELEELVSISSALLLNIGTLSKTWIEAMFFAAQKAKEKNIPIILDPVGSGATTFRTETTQQIIHSFTPTIIRGNASEILSLKKTETKTKGVDSLYSSTSAWRWGKQLAKQLGNVVVTSGEIDYVTDGKKVMEIKNGSPLMSKVTGMGCSATALLAAFSNIGKDLFQSSVSAMVLMGICGEMAAEKSKGPGTFQVNFIDALYSIDENEITKRIKIKEIYD